MWQNLNQLKQPKPKHPNPTYKKELGRWGEDCVDKWMLSQNWRAFQKNKYFRGGEIDRVYQENFILPPKKMCFAEIKTNVCASINNLQCYFTEQGLNRILKKRQIENLYRYAHFFQISHPQSHVFLRYFLVFKIEVSKNIKSFLENQNTFKVCEIKENYFILSFYPELIK